MTKAIVVTSGGMDSTTAVYWAYQQFDGDIACVSFNYGQRHKTELAYAKATADRIGVHHTIVDLFGVGQLISTSALTNNDIEVPEGHYAAENMAITVVPNRNAIMANIAIGYAISQGAECIVMGMHAGDHDVYPDCRPEFIEALWNCAVVANEGFIHPNFTVATPFIASTKADIASIGARLGVPWDMTWTCYKGGETHCGRCSTCVERLEAFHLAQVNDPTEYEDPNYYREVCGL